MLPVLPPGLWSVSLQSLTFFIELHVCSISLSKEAGFFREKSSLKAGTGARLTPIPLMGFGMERTLHRIINHPQSEVKIFLGDLNLTFLVFPQLVH